jgi:UPF0271 protein
VSAWLNIDLGERVGEPEALYAYAHVANVACGGHAGDDASMRRAIGLCRRFGTRLGAHPSYPDREGFGRRPLALSPANLRAHVAEQCRRLASLARELGQPIAFVKPHGALYHAAHSDPALAEALVQASIESLGTPIVMIGPSRGALAAAAAGAGMAYAREAFADRGVRPDGSLIMRGEPGALIVDPGEASARAGDLARDPDVDTICVHGDTPQAVVVAGAVRSVLDALAREPFERAARA